MANSMWTSALLLYLARRRFINWSMTTIPSLKGIGADWRIYMAAKLVYRLAILVANRRLSNMGNADSRSLRCDNYVRMLHFVRLSNYVNFRRF
jgi:hypothetical protein